MGEDDYIYITKWSDVCILKNVSNVATARREPYRFLMVTENQSYHGALFSLLAT